MLVADLRYQGEEYKEREEGRGTGRDMTRPSAGTHPRRRALSQPVPVGGIQQPPHRRLHAVARHGQCRLRRLSREAHGRQLGHLPRPIPRAEVRAARSSAVVHLRVMLTPQRQRREHMLLRQPWRPGPGACGNCEVFPYAASDVRRQRPAGADFATTVSGHGGRRRQHSRGRGARRRPVGRVDGLQGLEARQRQHRAEGVRPRSLQ